MTTIQDFEKDFLSVDDHSSWFIKYDALRCVEYDLAFSPAKLYYCGAGCQVCFIEKNLKRIKSMYADYVPETITDEQTKEWFEIFEYYYKVLVTDDLIYLKRNHPQMFEWYVKHAKHLEYGMTDNALITQMGILLNELTFKSICEISLSDEFIKKVNSKKNHNKVKEIVEKYLEKYNLSKTKYLYTLDENPDRDVHEIFDSLSDRGIINATQDDLRKDENRKFQSTGEMKQQSNWFATHKGNQYFIHGEQTELLGNSFYFNATEASDPDCPPFYTFETGKFNVEDMLVSMLKGKLAYYKRCIPELEDATDPWVIKIRDYYINTTEKFVINDDFNFIPKLMLNPNTKFYWKLSQTGYKNTEHGLYKPSEKPKSIIELRG